MNLSSNDIKSNVRYIMEGIKNIINSFGRRGPGDVGEILAQDYMASELSKYSDTVEREEFEVRPTAFMGWIYISCTMLIMAMALYFFFPIASLIILAIGILPMVFEFVMYKKFVDFLFEKKTSVNIFATRKPEGEVKRRIIFNGHSDAAYEWRWHYKYGAIGLKVCIFGSLIAFLYTLAITISTLATNGINAPTRYEPLLLALGFAQIVFLPIIISMFYFSNHNRPVPGANDNLSGAYMGMAVLKTLADNNIRYANTEVCCLITGSEEAGLRGAKVWAEKHKAEMQDAETAIIVFETLREMQYMAIYNKDLNGTVKNCPKVCNLLKDAAMHNGKNLKFGTVSLGSTDSAAFSQAGLHSAALAAMSPKPARYYHTRLDSYDNLNPECLELGYKIALDTLEMFDKDGLNS